MSIRATIASDTNDTNLNAAFAWLCERRKGYAASADVWGFRRDWLAEKARIRSDLLAGRYRFGRSKSLSVEETIARLPNIEREGLRGGVLYHDGQFDDARLLINLAQTAFEQGATVINYARVFDLVKDEAGFLSGVRVVDEESEEEFTAAGKVQGQGKRTGTMVPIKDFFESFKILTVDTV